MRTLWRELVNIVRGIAAELTDQRAYQQHLAAHGVTHSPEQWRRFQDELWAEKSRRVKCC
jgi:hypothetical protein